MPPKKAGICCINAPCKINLHLQVKNLRSDGFHEIESLFAALEFADTLRFELSGSCGNMEFVQYTDGAERIFDDYLQIPEEKNMVCRAISLFREKTGFDKGLKAELYKRIPVGAGLGGGSSDAASVLIALDYLAGSRLSEDEFMELALTLGSDVPFFLTGGAAWVRGRGEILEKTEIPSGLWALLVKPGFSISTEGAFRALDLCREKNQAPAPAGINFAQLRGILYGQPENWPFFNDFLPVLPGAGIFTDICAILRGEGAVFAGLSGSGSCCFGIFNEKSLAAKTCKKIQNSECEWYTKLTFFLARRPYPVLEL
ncbi:MAG: 4-(cytidine 5'-diphospho)-2-C-methyl-D-erythritol kinase [Treponema sp.]|jgi:4-diphosphocytidyl-2-C-methyl-D-erythritol kinase|nr:4-(cytidine 5'-diphospho)-2-C-methyl-D-erythritol kinase [Treponema sp.]